MATTINEFREGNPELRLRAGELLARYPHLELRELHELQVFYTTAPAIDTALLTCDPMLIPKIVQFQAEQRGMLKRQTQLGALVTITVLYGFSLIYAICAAVT
ncbi:hypothetical protein [Erythrobacter sp. MTPC3]|uniref:hypothetical protein n=1 Tax=Erythrobacter sp. MTPC3 TaxID=3056564 RepID=UPI0036F276B2